MRGYSKWDQRLLMADSTGSRLDRLFHAEYDRGTRTFDYGFIRAENLKVLICGISDEDGLPDKDEIKDCVSKLREVEEKVRNMAAHEIISMNDSIITARTGISPDGIVERIKKCFDYIGVDTAGKWSSYEDKNLKIIAAIESV